MQNFININFLVLLLFFVQAQAMALTIADAFKLAYEYYEKGKSTKSTEISRVAQQNNNENADKLVPEAKNGNPAIYATPAKAKVLIDKPSIQVTSDSSASAVEDSGRKIAALVMISS